MSISFTSLLEIPKYSISGSSGSCMFRLFLIDKQFSGVAMQVYIPTNIFNRVSLYLHKHFFLSHADRYAVIPHCGYLIKKICIFSYG